MGQFDVHRNPNPDTRGTYPYLLDVQAELFGDLATRVVIPLAPPDERRKPLERLTPLIDVGGEPFLLLTPQLAGVRIDVLGEVVSNVASQRDRIVQALDFLLTGS
jgi:toxin CcdB